MKNESGISMIILVISVILMVILVSVAVAHGGTSISEVKLQNFSYELQQIQGQVDSIHEKMKMEENPTFVSLIDKTTGRETTYGRNITLQGLGEALATLTKVKPKVDYSEGYSNLSDEKKKELYADQYTTKYRYLSAKELQDQLGINNTKRDVIINFETREVISVKPQICNDKPYYTLEDLKK